MLGCPSKDRQNVHTVVTQGEVKSWLKLFFLIRALNILKQLLQLDLIRMLVLSTVISQMGQAVVCECLTDFLLH